MSEASAEKARKLELLDRYRALRLEEMLTALRHEASRHAEEGRYAWRGEFLPRDEILALYKRRKSLDRRFTLDLAVVVLILAAVFFNGKRIVQSFIPRVTFPKEAAAAPAEPTAEKKAEKAAKPDPSAEKAAKRARKRAEAGGSGEDG